MAKFRKGDRVIEADPSMARSLRAVGWKPDDGTAAVSDEEEQAEQEALKAAEQEAKETEAKRKQREAEGRPPPAK